MSWPARNFLKSWIIQQLVSFVTCIFIKIREVLTLEDFKDTCCKCFMPCHEMPWTYSVAPFHPYIILSVCHSSQNVFFFHLNFQCVLSNSGQKYKNFTVIFMIDHIMVCAVHLSACPSDWLSIWQTIYQHSLIEKVAEELTVRAIFRSPE